MRISLYTDGGSKGNPGPAAIGLAMYEGDRPQNPGISVLENELRRYREDIGVGTNNEAEYTALIRGLEMVVASYARGLERLDCYSDSELMVRQLTGVYKVKDARIREFVFKIRSLESELGAPVHYHHILRGQNTLADALVNGKGI